MIALTIGGPASAFGTIPLTASPIAAKHPAPTSSVTTKQHDGRSRREAAPRTTSTPKTTVIATSRKPTSGRVEHPAPSGTTAAGNGVPRMRFRTPSSRANTTEIAMFV